MKTPPAFIVIELFSHGHGQHWTNVYGIFNSEEDAQSFVALRIRDGFAIREELTIRSIIPATAAGVL